MVSKKRLYLLILIFIHTLNFNSFAQEINSNDNLDVDFIKLILPPIDTLFKYSENSPKIKLQDYRILEQESNIKSEKRKWLNYFRFSSAYQYGYLGGESLIQGNLIPAYYQTSESAQNYYHIGVSFAVPFDDIIDRRNKVKKQKYIIEQLKYEKEINFYEQKYQIIELYSKAIEYISLIQTKMEAKNIAKMESSVGQEDFINGKISLLELSNKKQSESSAEADYEMLRSELRIVLMKLEIICNYKIPFINNL